MAAVSFCGVYEAKDLADSLTAQSVDGKWDVDCRRARKTATRFRLQGTSLLRTCSLNPVP